MIRGSENPRACHVLDKHSPQWSERLVTCQSFESFPIEILHNGNLEWLWLYLNTGKETDRHPRQTCWHYTLLSSLRHERTFQWLSQIFVGILWICNFVIPIFDFKTFHKRHLSNAFTFVCAGRLAVQQAGKGVRGLLCCSVTNAPGFIFSHMSTILVSAKTDTFAII